MLLGGFRFHQFIIVLIVNPVFQFEQFVVEDLQSVFDIDGLISSHPVYVPVSHPDEINEIFDRISYAKVRVSRDNSGCFVSRVLILYDKV